MTAPRAPAAAIAPAGPPLRPVADVPASEYDRRRRRIMQRMGSDSVAVVPAAAPRLRNGDTEHPFRQDSDFYYLTGFTEPSAVLVLVPGRGHGETLLFCAERDPARARWDGAHLGPEAAPEALGLDDAFPLTDLDDILPGLIEGRRRLYYTMGPQPAFDERMLGWLRSIRAGIERGGHPPGELVNLAQILHDMRLVKSRAELRLMRRAAEITCAAHERAMRFCRPGQYEWQLAAELQHEFMRSGAPHPAYDHIVAAGENACVMHYVDRTARIAPGELVLIDAGCEYASYASDVTRTFPASGRFSPEQREVYEIVLAAQQAAIEEIRAGADFDAPHRAVCGVLTQGLVDLGVLDGAVPELIERGAHRPFTMHRSSHWLGLDVHDVGDYRIDDVWRMLEPGMVMTIEPGLYFPGDQQGVPPRLAGIGVRIEDDVLVGRDGPEVLTEAAPRTVAGIETLMEAARSRADGAP